MPFMKNSGCTRNSVGIVRQSLLVGVLALLGSRMPCYGGDADVKLTTTNGSTKFTVQNSAGAEVASVNSLGGLTISSNAVLSGTTFYQGGSALIGTSSSMLGFFGAAPVVQPTNATDLRTALINLGLYATGGATPLNLNGGALTVASITSGNTPGIIQGGTGCGAVPTLSAGSNNVYGIVTCAAAGAPGASQEIARITPTVTCANQWVCTIYAGVAASAPFGNGTAQERVFVNGTSTTWSIRSGTTALGAGTTYIWNYNCGCI